MCGIPSVYPNGTKFKTAHPTVLCNTLDKHVHQMNGCVNNRLTVGSNIDRDKSAPAKYWYGHVHTVYTQTNALARKRERWHAA